MKVLIINADDFGKNALVNRGILKAFRRGICSSATLMSNQPGFEEACQMIHANRLIRYVGIHLVLRGGAPLTEKIRGFSRFCDSSGQLCLSRESQNRPVFHLTLPEKRALAEEIRAQVDRCRSQRIPLTHLDSHYHLHNEWAVAQVLFPLMKELKIPYVRIARNCGKALGLGKRIYKSLLNRQIRKRGLQRTRYFGGIPDYGEWKQPGRTLGGFSEELSFEMMIHPVWEEEKQCVMDGIDQISLEQAIPSLNINQEAVSFDGSRYV